MALIESYEHAIVWLVLLIVLYSIVSGKLRFDLTAFGCLLFLGVLGFRNPGQLFSGFSSPALFTIAIVIVMSAGIVESGLLTGFGKNCREDTSIQESSICLIFFHWIYISIYE